MNNILDHFATAYFNPASQTAGGQAYLATPASGDLKGFQTRTSVGLHWSIAARSSAAGACAGTRYDGTQSERPHIMNNVIDFINVNRERYLDELKALLAIPSISALPEHAGDVRLRRLVRGRNAPRWPAERAGSSKHRATRSSHGDWLGAEGALTILFYGHYDVQPVDPLDLWQTPPLKRRFATARFMRVAPPTTRDRSSCTSQGD